MSFTDRESMRNCQASQNACKLFMHIFLIINYAGVPSCYLHTRSKHHQVANQFCVFILLNSNNNLCHLLMYVFEIFQTL